MYPRAKVLCCVAKCAWCVERRLSLLSLFAWGSFQVPAYAIDTLMIVQSFLHLLRAKSVLISQYPFKICRHDRVESGGSESLIQEDFVNHCLA